MKSLFLMLLAAMAMAVEPTIPANAPVGFPPAAVAPAPQQPVVAPAAPVAAPVAVPTAPAAAQPEPPKSWWMEIIAAVVALAGVWIRKKINDVAAANIAKSEAEAEVAGQDAKQRLVARAKTYIWRTVANYNQKYLPELCEAIARGQVNSVAAVQERLKGLGTMLMADAVAYFKTQDIDLIKEVGQDQIMSWIRSAVDELSPFQKYPTAKALVEGGAELAVKYGLDVAGRKFTEYLEVKANADVARLIGPVPGYGGGVAQGPLMGAAPEKV
jgi:hypothetical protein